MHAGPIVAIDVLLPTNKPAPMMPPMVIIATWRVRSVRPKAGEVETGSAPVVVLTCINGLP